MTHPDSSMSGVSGIYAIRFITGKMYVGSAVNLKKRLDEHRRDLNRGRHHSILLQRAWNKYGSDAFEWAVLEYVEPARLIEREQHFIDAFDATKKGFNISPTAGSCLGLKPSEESKARMSKAQRGRKHLAETRAKIGSANRNPSPETRAKMSLANRNRSPETKAKLIAANLGRKHLPETIAKLAAAAKNRSPEHRAKIGAASRGRRPTAETKAKMSEAHKGKTHTLETRAKMSKFHQGKTYTLETRAKMSAAHAGKTKRKRPSSDQMEFDF